uniref:Uncharacterized protein n=1 Tax=Oryza nivara TaxID=4536 RepID=A0A0E0IS53_ORYNI
MVHMGRRRWLPSPSLADLAGGGRREAGGDGEGSPPPPSQIRPEGGLEIGGRTRKDMNGNGSAKEGGK